MTLRKSILIFLPVFLLVQFSAFSQTGHNTITFNDPARTGGFGSGGGPGRQIQTEIYYPAATTADDVPVTGSNHPVLVFGHGFSMAWDAYANVWEGLVADGYVIAFPRTEGGLSPSHADFGKDLALVVNKVKDLNTNSASLFFGKLASTSAIMGHSMGGGSSFLAGANNTSITAMVTFAAANTSPSSFAAAKLTGVPNLILIGQNDCVTPPLSHQKIMYDSLASVLKTEITIKGGGHCYFANSNFNCTLGETTCTPSPTISRAAQQDAALDYTKLWLKRYLKNDCQAGMDLQDSLLLSPRITWRQNASNLCGAAGVNSTASDAAPKIFPNPAHDELLITGIPGTGMITVTDVSGRVLITAGSFQKELRIPVNEFSPGLYILRISDEKGNSFSQRWIKN